MTLEVSAEFLDTQLAKRTGGRPLVIGISGPQGSGKSYLADHLQIHVHNKYPHLTCVGVSIDDFYLSHKEQEIVTNVARKSGNFLLEGRGLPGTHDLQLAIDTLSSLVSRKCPTRIPRYNKSAYNGEGDRLTEEKWQVVDKPVDVVVFEGWFLGYQALDPAIFPSVYLSHDPSGVVQQSSMHHLQSINSELSKYYELWNFVDVSVIISTDSIDNVYIWRLQQEADLIQKLGSGMSETAVAAFVRRYMPMYYLYYKRLVADGLSAKGTNLVLSVDVERKVISRLLR